MIHLIKFNNHEFMATCEILFIFKYKEKSGFDDSFDGCNSAASAISASVLSISAFSVTGSV